MAENSAPIKPTRPAISRPVFERTFKINSEQAIRVIRNSYERLIRSLYAIDVILRIVGQEQAIDEIEKTAEQYKNYEKFEKDTISYFDKYINTRIESFEAQLSKIEE